MYTLQYPILRELSELEVARNRFRTMSRTIIFKRFKAEQFELQNGCCYYCNLPFYEEYQIIKWNRVITRTRFVEVDHVIALSNGGSNEYSNFVLSCQECNLRKGSKELVVAHG